MTVDLQRKYRYTINIRINSSDTSHTAQVDEFTPPDVRSEPVTRLNQKLGQIALAGPKTYGEMTFRLTLRIGESEVANLIDDLEDLQIDDTDTCEITLMSKAMVGGAEEVSYSQSFQNCRLTGYKLDPFSRKADDDFVHIEITLIPSKVGKVKKVGS